MSGERGRGVPPQNRNFFLFSESLYLVERKVAGAKIVRGEGRREVTPLKSKFCFAKWLYVRETKAIQAKDVYGVVGGGLSDTQNSFLG